MHVYYDVKDMLHKELEDIAKKGELSAGSLDTIDKLLHSLKNASKMIMYEQYAGDGYSYADADMDMTEYSYARGRGSGAKRDSMGRYSSDGGYYDRGGRRDGRGGYSRRGYSYADGDKEEKVEMLREMMKEVSSDDERRALQKIIRRYEQE
jgi:hypothetical protein